MRAPRRLLLALALLGSIGLIVFAIIRARVEMSTSSAEFVWPRDLNMTEPLRLESVHGADDPGALTLECERVWKIEKLRLGDRSRAELEAHWSGWRTLLMRIAPPPGQPLALTVFDARRPRIELAHAELEPSESPRDIAFAWRPSRTTERTAHVQFLHLEAQRISVLSSAEIRGWSAPAPDETEEHVRTDSIGWWICEGRRGMPPRVASVSWCGSLSADEATNQLWPSRTRTHFTASLDDRDELTMGTSVALWSWPVWIIATERAEVLDPPLKFAANAAAPR